MFEKLFKKTKPTLVNKNWRSGMWIVTDTNEVGILVTVSDPCEIHLIDLVTGETNKVISVPLSTIRQAVWEEIPLCRRNISIETGKALGYGS